MSEPDTFEEFIEAAKVFDLDNDGKIEVQELRWAMTKLGDQMDDQMVDDMIAELDKEKSGLIEILDMAKATFQIKEEKKGDDKKEKKDAKKKWVHTHPPIPPYLYTEVPCGFHKDSTPNNV